MIQRSEPRQLGSSNDQEMLLKTADPLQGLIIWSNLARASPISEQGEMGMKIGGQDYKEGREVARQLMGADKSLCHVAIMIG